MDPLRTSAPQPGQLYRLAWGFYLLLAAGAVIWVGLREGRVGLALFVDSQSWWLDLLWGAATAAVLLVVWKAAESALPLARELERHLRGILGRLDHSEVFALALLSGFSEELFFRGAVQGSWGWLWAAILFAILHSGPGKAFRLWSAFALLAGSLFGGLMLWRGSLLAPMFAHFLVNLVNLGRLTRIPAEATEPTEDPG